MNNTNIIHRVVSAIAVIMVVGLVLDYAGEKIADKILKKIKETEAK